MTTSELFLLVYYSYPGMVLQGTLLGGTDLRYVDAAFSRDGARVAAFGNRTDHLATVWNVKKNPTDGDGLTGEKVRMVGILEHLTFQTTLRRYWLNMLLYGLALCDESPGMVRAS